MIFICAEIVSNKLINLMLYFMGQLGLGALV